MNEVVSDLNGSESEPSAWRSRRSLLVALVVIGGAFGWILVRVLGLHVGATGDIALTELIVRDVGSSHSPLVGSYSRFGWHHPGPAVFYALALPYRLLGSDPSALLGGAVILNGASVVAIAVTLWRRGRTGGLIVGSVVFALLLRGFGVDQLASPWNPYVGVLPMAVFVLAVWSVTCGDRWMLPVAVGFGSFIAQAHVGTGGVVVVGLVVAVSATVAAARRADADRDDRNVWLVTGAVAIVLWIAPLVDAARNRGGNLRSLGRYWLSSHDQVVGWSRAARIVGSELAVPGPWLSGNEARAAFTGGLDPRMQPPWVLAAVLVAVVVAARRGDRTSFRLGVISLGLALVAWVSVARIVDEPFDYLVRWTWLVGAFGWLTVGWTALGILRSANPRWARAIGGVVAATAVVVVGIVVVESANVQPPFPSDVQVLHRLQPRLERRAARLTEPVLVESKTGIGSGSLADAVVMAFQRQGIDARYSAGQRWRVGAEHVVDSRRAGSRLIVSLDTDVGELLGDRHYRRIATFDELRPGERAEWERINAQLPPIADVPQWAKLHPELWQRYRHLNHSTRAVVLLRRG